MRDLNIPKKDQIDGILSRYAKHWAVGVLRSHGYKDRDFKQDDPFKYLGYEDFITVSDREIFSAAEEYGFENLIPHYLERGEGGSLYQDASGLYIYSHIERGEESVRGKYSTLKEAQEHLVRLIAENARRNLNRTKNTYERKQRG